MELHSLECMIVLITFVTYASPVAMFEVGCSESIPFGITHETAGSWPALAAA